MKYVDTLPVIPYYRPDPRLVAAIRLILIRRRLTDQLDRLMQAVAAARQVI